jgi:Rrf2 family protein
LTHLTNLGIIVIKYLYVEYRMSSVVHISEATSLGLHAMAVIASQEGGASVGNISKRLGVSEFHLSKVLQRLGKSGLVNSSRGPRGGFVLAGRGDAVSLLDVFEAIEGPLVNKDCLLKHKSCNKGGCILGDTLGSMSAIFESYLRKTMVSDLAHIFTQDGKR